MISATRPDQCRTGNCRVLTAWTEGISGADMTIAVFLMSKRRRALVA
jgi:hypothetical protein